MIYNEMLYFFGFLPKDLQLITLILLGIMLICILKSGKKLRINLLNFIPIFLMLSLTIINKLIYFLTMINVTDETKLLKWICIIALIIFIGCKFGIFWVGAIFVIPLISIFVPPLRIVVIGAMTILSFLLNTPFP